MKRRIAIFTAIVLSMAPLLAQTSISSREPTKQTLIVSFPNLTGLKFCGVTEDTFTILNVSDRTPPSFLPLGGTIPKTGYTIVDYRTKSKTPTIIIENKTAHSRIELEVGTTIWIKP